MYCVIQKVKNKKSNSYGEYKELKVGSTTWTIDGVTKTKYYYTHAGERFERPIKDSYKISIHESYRDNGKVKKKQWVICTMSYYSIADGWTWIGDHTIGLSDKLQDIGITEEKLCELVYKKLDPIIEEIESEFQHTEEYKTKQKHREIIDKYNKAKTEFESAYGKNTYDYCYDVFGELRNEEMLNNIKAQYKARQEYERSYYENFKSNYNYDSQSSYQAIKQSNYTEEEKKRLKKIYKTLALNFHPDRQNGDDEMMKFINKLKTEWDI